MGVSKLPALYFLIALNRGKLSIVITYVCAECMVLTHRLALVLALSATAQCGGHNVTSTIEVTSPGSIWKVLARR